MGYKTFTPVIAPTSYDNTSEIKTINVDFGDGYSQVSADGLNAKRNKLSVRWSNLLITQCKSFDAFFEAQCAQPFFWKAPQTTVSKLWRCTSWKASYHETIADFDATFEEVFA